MVKILIANKDITDQNLNEFQFLRKYPEYRIKISNTGIETIKQCMKIKPNIILLCTNIEDVPFYELLYRLSKLPDEESKSNVILIVENEDEKKLLTNTSKLCEIIDKNFEIEELKNLLEHLKIKYKFPELTYADITALFSELEVSPSKEGSSYMQLSIYNNYYSLDEYPKLVEIYDNIYKNFKIEPKITRNRMRTSLHRLNNSYNPNEHPIYAKIFGTRTNITPKEFIDCCTDYFIREKHRDD